jgi:hypothetical protein
MESEDRQRRERREDEISPAEFTRRMPEGEGAGPGAPETLEPHGGAKDGEGREPGGPPMRGIGEDRS